MVTISEIEPVSERFITSGIYLKNWATRTVRTYRQGFRALTRALRDAADDSTNATDALAKPHLEAFVVSLRQRGVSPGGCNMYLRTINSFLSWLHEEGRIETKLRIKLLHQPRNPPAVFTDADVRLIVGYKPTSFSSLRLWTLINVLIDTGVRIDEALGLRVVDCDLENLFLTVLGKGSKERKVPVSLALRKVLWRYVQVRERRHVPGAYLFGTRTGNRLSYRNVHRDLVALCGRLGIQGPRVSPHTFRHYFAVSYIRNGGDLYRLSRILGHTSVKTTEIYLRSMGFDALADRHQQLSPLNRLGQCR
jgi:integrase/recombinase XerD